MLRANLTLRELADMRDAQRDSVKYLSTTTRELVERRHVYRDDDEREDYGDCLLGSKSA